MELAIWYAEQYGGGEPARVKTAMIVHPDMTDDRANRWLGYIQGWLARDRVYTVDDLRAHIRERVWEG